MESIRVSYILSTKDRAAHLERTLANVREFITPADELIVVDGGSRDATAEVVRRHAGLVTQFLSEPDRGEAHGFNKGLLLARGAFLKPVTDDDYIYPDAMRACISALERDPALDGLLCGGEQVEEIADGTTRVRHYFRLPPGASLDSRWVVRVGCGLGLILHRRVVARAGLFDPAYLLADIDYLERVLRAGCALRYLDVKLFRHAVAAHSLSRRVDERDRDWLRLELRAGSWPQALNAHPEAAACRALGIVPESRDAVLVRSLRDLAWLHGRAPAFAHAVAALTHGLRTVLQHLGTVVKRVRRVAPETTRLEEPGWDGGMR